MTLHLNHLMQSKFSYFGVPGSKFYFDKYLVTCTSVGRAKVAKLQWHKYLGPWHTAQWHSGSVAQWHNAKYLGPGHSGTVAQWLSGSVAQCQVPGT